MVDENNLQFAENPELERAKVWWKEHGRAIVVGVGLGLTAVFGFNYWQHYQQTQAENASLLFDRLQDAVQARAQTEDASPTAAETESETESDATNASDVSIEVIANDLMSDYQSTPYAVHAAFALAKFSVETAALEQAAQALRWALEHADDNGMRHIARLRLASVLLAQGSSEAVLTLLDVEDKEEFATRYDELEGDASLQKGDSDRARNAYQRSLDALTPNSGEHHILKLKRESLGN